MDITYHQPISGLEPGDAYLDRPNPDTVHSLQEVLPSLWERLRRPPRPLQTLLARSAPGPSPESQSSRRTDKTSGYFPLTRKNLR